MPKAGSSRKGQHRHNPLEHDIVETGILRNKPSKKRKAAADDGDDDGGKTGDGFIDATASRKILAIGRELLEEEEGQQRQQAKRVAVSPPQTDDAPGYAPRPTGTNGLVDDDSDDDNGAGMNGGNANDWEDEDDDYEEEVEMDPQDLEMYKRFLPENEDLLLVNGLELNLSGNGTDQTKSRQAQEESAGAQEGTNLADLILAKIAEFEAANGQSKEPMPVDDLPELSPKIVEVYTRIGEFLAHYRSGKLPKPFKILPQIPRWEEIIQHCKPWDWTPQACDAATKLFVASKPIVVQRFLEHVILEKVRDDISESKKLNPHLFSCLRRSLFKPSAFFKGFLFPLVASGTCTLREAHIVSGVLLRVSVPILHSAAAIKGLCDIAAQEASQGTEGGGATNVLIRTLLAKRMALPYQVIDALVFHFLRFRSVDPAAVRESADLGTVGLDQGSVPARVRLPVIWHQCLLEFAQRYKNDITEDQREALLDLLLTHGHATIGVEVRRELLAGRGRGVPIAPQEAALDGDDTMLID